MCVEKRKLENGEMYPLKLIKKTYIYF